MVWSVVFRLYRSQTTETFHLLMNDMAHKFIGNLVEHLQSKFVPIIMYVIAAINIPSPISLSLTLLCPEEFPVLWLLQRRLLTLETHP